MKRHLRYLSYVIRHKWFVFVYGFVMGVPIWRLIIHDWSKLSPAEWGPYARRFGSGRAGQLKKSADPEDFHRAWTHHWHLNPHHWEHWLRMADDNLPDPMEMPEHFIREMVADWMAAGRAQTGKQDAQAWYAKNRDRLLLTPSVRSSVEHLLSTYARRER